MEPPSLPPASSYEHSYDSYGSASPPVAPPSAGSSRPSEVPPVNGNALRNSLTLTGEKRKRNPLACEPCRTRKAKCNGEQPLCDQCKTRSLECHYRHYQRKNQRTDIYISELEARIRQLEGGENGDFKVPLPPIDYDNRLDALSSAATMIGANGHPREYGWNEDTDGAHEDNATADGMGVPGEGSTSSFFGKSAISTVFKAMQPNPDGRGPSQLSPNAVPPTPRSLPPTLASQDDHGLPPRDLADALVHAYWQYVHTLYPFLNEHEYRERYARLWTDPGDADFLDLGIFNLICALGTHFMGDRISPDDAVALSARFFKRARDILGARLMSVGSLRSVQALLLMGQYAQSANHPNFCWNTVGLAVRICQGLGLHIEATDDEELTSVEREIRRRTYWTCFVMDRMVSTTFGRPTAIREDMTSVDLPSPLLDITLVPESEMPNGQPDLIHFFVRQVFGDTGTPASDSYTAQIATVKLSRIMSSVLDALYAQTGNLVSEHVPMTRLLELDSQLKAWETQLPVFLRPQTAAEQIPWPAIFRQRNVLRMRALNVRVLLHRPCLLLVARESHAPDVPTLALDLNLETSTVRQSARICIEAARQSIELVHATFRDINTTGAHWYSLYYAFQSAVCILLLLEMNGDAHDGTHPELPFEARDEAALEQATAILSQLSSKSPTAATCYASLTQVRARAGRSRRMSASRLEPVAASAATSPSYSMPPQPATSSLQPVAPPLIPGDITDLGLAALWAPDASASDWSFDNFFSSSSLPLPFKGGGLGDVNSLLSPTMPFMNEGLATTLRGPPSGRATPNQHPLHPHSHHQQHPQQYGSRSGSGAGMSSTGLSMSMGGHGHGHGHGPGQYDFESMAVLANAAGDWSTSWPALGTPNGGRGGGAGSSSLSM